MVTDMHVYVLDGCIVARVINIIQQQVKWFRKAAEQGYADAQYNLGHMYENGWGVDRNNSTVVEWYRKGAEQGDAYAQFYLGHTYV